MRNLPRTPDVFLILRLLRRHPEGWIEPHIKPVHAAMEMGAGGPAGLSHMADQLTLPDMGADLRLHGNHVDENGLDAEAVVDDDRAAGQEEVAGDQPHG